MNNAAVQVYIDYFDATGKIHWVETSDINTGYQKLINKHVTPAKTAYAVLRATQDNASGAFYVDEMRVNKTVDM